MRLHLTLALLTALALFLTFRSTGKPRFSFADVQAMAQRQAQLAYQPLPDILPPQLKALTPDQERGIFWNDAYRLWRKKGLPFQVDFYPLSNDQHTSPAINTVDRKGAHPLVYSSSFFHINVPINPPLPANLGFGGFYLRYPDMAPNSNPASLDGFFSAKGASYFRVIAKEQVYGLSSRGLGINSINEKNEEFPVFKDWWLQQPAASDTQLVMYALLDSPSVSGAYRFTIRPGGVTSVDIHATLFFRKAVSQLGIAPFSSMYLYGENAKNHFGNFHPEIHDSDGIVIHHQDDTWTWRPLEQETQRQVNVFGAASLKGFGLVQRDRDFQHYQDLEMNYNVRPSAWVTPHGDWGKGSVELVQLVTNNTNTDNVVVFWHPETAPKAGDRLDLDYTIDYYMNDATRPPLAYTKQTLVNDPAPPPPPPPAPVDLMGPPAPVAKNSKPAPSPTPPPPPDKNATTPVQFLVDFMGNGIEQIPPGSPPKAELTCLPAGTIIRESNVQKNGYDNSWRVTFTIIPLKHFVPTELSCRLVRDGKPLTETWTYTWHQ
jgi:glucans biosynthesis protein